MRTLGIDHGERHVGLALSDEEGRIAHPHGTLERRDPRALLDAIAKLVDEEGVEAIVVGLPLTLEGREGASARRARRFAELLEERTGIAVVLWDERMTTLAAERALGEAGVGRRARKGVVDRVAASLLLSSYLDAARARDDEGERDPRWRTREAREAPGEDAAPASDRRAGPSRER